MSWLDELLCKGHDMDIAFDDANTQTAQYSSGSETVLPSRADK